MSEHQEHQEHQYLNLMKLILQNGYDKPNRTKIPTRSITAATMEFELTRTSPSTNKRVNIIPLLTTKFVSFRLILTELLWFLSADSNSNTLAKKYKNHIWDANGTREFLDNRGLTSNPVGELGPIYGVQWRRWNSSDPKQPGSGIDQIANVIQSIKSDPFGRRHIVTAWNPEQLDQMALPPCFLPGTLVLTKRGYVNIEDVLDDDLLLSHIGNFNKILEKHITNYTGKVHELKIKFHPHNIKTTPEHPFYVKKHRDVEPEWVKASDITSNDYVGFPINKNNIVPSFKQEIFVNQYAVKNKTFYLDNLEYWFIMGYFMGDGWLDWSNEKKYRFYLVFNNADMLTVFPRISKILTLSHKNMKGTGCKTYECRMISWWMLLKEFGHLAHNKKIPEWVQDAPVEYIEKFIEGYIAADGCKTMENMLICATTVSPHIAFGMQRLYAKLGKIISVRFQKKPKTHIIENRIVNQRDLYYIAKTKNDYNSSFVFSDNDYVWFSVLDNETINVEDTKVYNFAVENEHTYIVENISVHNCHFAFQFIVRPEFNNNNWDEENPFQPQLVKPYWLDCILMQRSADVPLGVPFNMASYATLTHMVAHLVGLVPGKLVHVMNDVHIYHNQFAGCYEQLQRIPKQFPELRLKRHIDNIDDFQVDDFELIDYNPDPSIKFPFAI